MQLRIVDPANCISRAHQKPSGIRSRQIFFPEFVRLRQPRRIGLSRALTKLPQQLIHGIRIHQVGDVVLHRGLKNSALQRHSAARHLNLVDRRFPVTRRRQIFRMIGHNPFALRTQRTRNLGKVGRVAIRLIRSHRALDGNIVTARDHRNLRQRQVVVGTVFQRRPQKFRRFHRSHFCRGQAHISPRHARCSKLSDVVFWIGKVRAGKICNCFRVRHRRVIRRFNLEPQRKTFAAVIFIQQRIHALARRIHLDRIDCLGFAQVNLQPGIDVRISRRLRSIGAIKRRRSRRHLLPGGIAAQPRVCFRRRKQQRRIQKRRCHHTRAGIRRDPEKSASRDAHSAPRFFL